MLRETILVLLPLFAAGLVSAYDGEVTVDSRFVAFGFDDGRQSDFDWVAPLFTKHGVHATFNIINTPYTSRPDYVAKVNKLIAEGHEIGDHTVLHRTYMYVHPFCNGQPEQNHLGGKGIPSNDDMRKDRGDGRNIFNTPLDQKLKDSQFYKFEQIAFAAPENGTWRTLTDEDCQKIRDYYSVWNSGNIDYLDELSATYCGTTGKSKDPDSWNGKEFTKGIFTGCKTTCNHEIWDRLVEIQRQWYTKHYNLKTPPTNWSFPGGPHCPNLLHIKDGKRFFDRECTIPANDHGKCRSTRTGRRRSWGDLARENGIKTVSDTLYEGRMDGCVRRSILIEMPLNANLSKEDNACRLAYFDKVSFAPGQEYDPKQEPLAGSKDWLKTMYEVDPTFKRGIDKIVRDCTSGRIAFGLNDSVDTFTWRLLFDLFLQFCHKADINVVSMREAYEIAYTTPLTKGNFFRNANMERTVLKVIGAKNSPETPDGWTAGCVEEAAVPDRGTVRVLALDGANKSEFFLFGVPLGTLELSFAALKGPGPSKLTVRKIRNVDPYLKASECPAIAEIAIDDGAAWKQYRTKLVLEDAPGLPAPSDLSPTCGGLDNKICGMVFVLEGEKTKFANPNLHVAPE